MGIPATSNRLTCGRALTALLSAVLVCAPLRSVEGSAAKSPVHRPAKRPAVRSTSHKSSARTSGHRHTASVSTRRGKSRKAKPRRSTAYTRLAKMQMDPTRVESIQQALINAGTYHGTPTGRWDEETRDAMSRYQAANGFGVTGLPDAKSLMKMGLGPHPLPAELNKAPDAASVQPDASAGATSPALSAPPPDKPTPDATDPAATPQSIQDHR